MQKIFFPAILILTGILWPLDRIIMTDGTIIVCNITSQTEEIVSYAADGLSKTVPKENISSMQLDIDVDKYYLAYESAETTDKRLIYFFKSREAFPNQDYNQNLNIMRCGCTYALLEPYLPRLKALKKISMRFNLLSLSELQKLRAALPDTVIDSDTPAVLNAALREAVSKNNLADVKKYYSLGADGRQAVIYLFLDKRDVMRFLIDYYPQMDFPQIKTTTRLMLFSAIGDLNGMTEELKKNADPNQANKAGWTALMFAAWQGHAEAVKLLLQSGALTEPERNKGMTPLMLYAAAGMIGEFSKELEKNTISEVDQAGRNALTWAAMRGQSVIIKILLQKGADANFVNNGEDPVTRYKWPALKWAISSGSLEAVKLLVEAGADLNAAGIPDPSGSGAGSPLGLAQSGKPEIFNYLLEKGAALDTGYKGFSFLHQSAGGGHLSFVKYLTEEKKHNVNTLFGPHTPLTAAAAGGHYEVLEYLISHGADINFRGYRGTALALARENGYHKCASLLKSAGALERFNDTSAAEKIVLLKNGLAKYPDFDYYRTLDFSKSDLSDALLLNEVIKFTGLNSLNIEYCTNITAVGINACLSALTNIKYLFLSYTAVDDEVIKKIKPGTLGAIRLSGTKISDASLSLIAKNHPNLEMTALNFTPITDKGFKILSALTNLQAFEFTGTRISDSSFKLVLPSLKNINYLNGEGTDISDECAVLLKTSLPKINNLVVSGTQMSAAELLDIARAFPNLKMYNNNYRQDSLKYYYALAELEKKQNTDLQKVDLKEGIAYGIRPGMTIEQVKLLYGHSLVLSEGDQYRTAAAQVNFRTPYCSVKTVKGRVIAVGLKPGRFANNSSEVFIGAFWKNGRALPAPEKSISAGFGQEYHIPFASHGLIIRVSKYNDLI
ncbi:MAG TPA: hypothetical protein DC049_16750, partial [Spirochaetia bacterium]|nr:hypothetical protein [Spirochaetia bacterium]